VSDDRPELILILAPIGRDAELMCGQLQSAGMQCQACSDIDDLCGRLPDGVGAIVLTEEALPTGAMSQLLLTLEKQPKWSEVPLIILTGAPSYDAKQRSFDLFGRRTNITLVDRPVRIKSLISAAQSAIRARQRQYDIRDLMGQLEERIHERDRFLAVLGHELRNPLGAILLASQMTGEDGRLDYEHARLIERQSRHLTRLVNDLLDLSRVAAGKITLKMQIAYLKEIAQQSMRVVQPQADQQKIAIRFEPPQKSVLVYADPVRVEQIITNILTNAVKYTPEGGHVEMQVGVENGRAAIRVKDDGVGIPNERIDNIFELFAQAENSIGRAQGGMGIGLALVRNLVELHGGTVSASSDGAGTGSEFIVRLPQAKEEERATTRPEVRPSRTERSATLARRIVIVEDNADVRDLLRLKLKRLGHTVSDARDGVEGVKVVLNEKPDLALVDLGLPGLDGYQVARQVREQLGDDVVLVAVSGFGQPEDKRRAPEAGFDDHITKPADVQDIENVLQRFPPRNSSGERRV